jgi:hypothetical protein
LEFPEAFGKTASYGYVSIMEQMPAIDPGYNNDKALCLEALDTWQYNYFLNLSILIQRQMTMHYGRFLGTVIIWSFNFYSLMASVPAAS